MVNPVCGDAERHRRSDSGNRSIEMEVSKVVYGERILIDLTEDTVTEGDLRTGVRAHGANGANGDVITGTGNFYSNVVEIVPIEFNYRHGYIGLRQTADAVNLLYFCEGNPKECYLIYTK